MIYYLIVFGCGTLTGIFLMISPIWISLIMTLVFSIIGSKIMNSWTLNQSDWIKMGTQFAIKFYQSLSSQGFKFIPEKGLAVLSIDKKIVFPLTEDLKLKFSMRRKRVFLVNPKPILESKESEEFTDYTREIHDKEEWIDISRPPGVYYGFSASTFGKQYDRIEIQSIEGNSIRTLKADQILEYA